MRAAIATLLLSCAAVLAWALVSTRAPNERNVTAKTAPDRVLQAETNPRELISGEARERSVRSVAHARETTAGSGAPRPSNRLQGRVTDTTSGGPLFGASLLLEPVGGAPGDARSVAADREGRYELTDIASGNHTLRCTHPGYGAIEVRYVVFGDELPREQTHDVTLAPGNRISGFVLAPDGTGLPGIGVRVQTNVERGAGSGSAMSRTDGSFEIVDLVDGEYLFEIESNDWLLPHAITSSAGVTAVRLELVPRAQLFGRVTDAARATPLSSFSLVLREPNPDDPALGAPLARFEQKDAVDGTFKLAGVGAGEYVVEARAPGFASGFASGFSDPVRVDPSAPAPFAEIALGPGGTLSGRVVDATSGNPIEGALVTTRDNHWADAEYFRLHRESAPSAMTWATVTTDADGLFRIERMTRGPYQVEVTSSGFAAWTENDVELREGVLTDLGRIALSPGAVEPAE